MIRRRHFLTMLGAAVTAPCASALPTKAATPQKKGWAGGNAEMHKLFGAHWYYNWTPNIEDSRAEFVPLMKGEWNINPDDFTKVGGNRKGKAILGFNEPERQDQGNVTLARAIELWPQLAKLAKKERIALGSPATSSDDKGGQWMQAFMQQVEEKKLQVDFIAVHWYRSRNVDQFKSFIDGYAQKYQRKVWITEFNGGPSGDITDHLKFLEGALKYLEESPNVERYAFFNPSAGDPYSLVQKDKKPTALGELYKAAGT
jgi:Glycosyl hydrolase catalytic core